MERPLFAIAQKMNAVRRQNPVAEVSESWYKFDRELYHLWMLFKNI